VKTAVACLIAVSSLTVAEQAGALSVVSGVSFCPENNWLGTKTFACSDAWTSVEKDHRGGGQHTH
jgi:hypothetical protein